MKENYIKIKFVGSTPFISIQYDSIESFQNLIFFLMSPTGTELFLKTIEKDLVEQNKSEELEIIKAFMYIISQDQDNALLNALDSNKPLIKPGSFK
jgi:hypothetical protein